jgi:glycosyltransferase involved in cell wall biosynthesis
MTATASRPRVRIVQVSRQIAPGGGVSGVADQMEKGFLAAGYECRRVTLDSVGISSSRPLHRSRIVNKARLMRDVVWYTIAGTVFARVRYGGRRNVLICHNDALVGDIYINHGLHKLAVMGSSRASRMLRNPLHLFIYLREELRHRLRLHRRIITLSSKDTRDLAKAYPVSRGRVVELANGVDVRRFIAARPRRAAVRASLQVGPDQHVLLFVGHEFDRKGLYPTIAALAQLDDRYRLWVVGGDESMIAAARAEAARHGVEARITFFGTRREGIEDFFVGADIFVLASSYEAAPLALLEAMAAGAVPICTPVGSAPDIIDNGVNGFLIDRSAQSIVEAAKAATQSPQSLAALSGAAFARAQDFDWPRVIARYVELIEALHVRRRAR